MIALFDRPTKQLIASISPRWREVRVGKRDYTGLVADSFRAESIIFVKPSSSLLCAVDSKDLSRDLVWEYFPIAFRIVDADGYAPDDWITLAQAGRASELDRKLRWLFETPSLTLTEGVEEFGQDEGASRKSYAFRFYNSVLISDPKGRGSLRLTASDIPGFILTAELTFGPGAA